jgi:tripartite-type tricarboxylate transporter receptor subunit TctC
MVAKLFQYVLFSATVGLLAIEWAAASENYPSKPVRIIVPYPPGGGVDAVARLVSSKLSERIGQQIVIDNRGGAGGNIGTELASRSVADGYTLVMGAAALAINVSLYKKLPFDPLKDFAPISLLASTPNIVAVHPSLPVKSVKELIALAQQNPGIINYGSAGNGTTSHLAGELLKSMAKIDIVHVPYKGTTAAIVAILSGESPLMLAPALTLKSHINAGKIRGLAITSKTRSEAFPKLGTVSESGLKGYEASQWYGILAPRGLATQHISFLHKNIVAVMRDEMVKSSLSNEGSLIIGSTPSEFSQHINSEIEKWEKVVKQSSARID